MTKPGEVYRVDLGMSGKVRMMIVVSRQDEEAPRALSLCVPITSTYRESDYEVEIRAAAFLSMKSYANVQGLQAIQDHELDGPIGKLHNSATEEIKQALRFAIELKF